MWKISALGLAPDLAHFDHGEVLIEDGPNLDVGAASSWARADS